MKKLMISAMATALALSFAAPAEAAGTQKADVQAFCKAKAAKKFSAVHFLQRRNFVHDCVAQHASTNTQAKAKPVTADKGAKATTTGQSPKQGQ